MAGTECIRRALCETSQQRTDGEPDEFLVEIMRAIFSLPTQQDIHGQANGHADKAAAARDNGTKKTTTTAADTDPLHRMYDEAIASGRLNGDCAQQYDQCEGSVWTGSFKM